MVGQVLEVEKLTGPLKCCKIDIGDEEPVAIVTKAPNVRDESRIAVAMIGHTYTNSSGEEQTITKVSIAGRHSHGMICDSQMLGWRGGGEGIAVQMPADLALGTEAPLSRPGRGGEDDKGKKDGESEELDAKALKQVHAKALDMNTPQVSA